MFMQKNKAFLEYSYYVFIRTRWSCLIEVASFGQYYGCFSVHEVTNIAFFYRIFKYPHKYTNTVFGHNKSVGIQEDIVTQC